MNTDFSAAISMRGFARLFGAGRFFTNTTPEGAPKLGPETRGWAPLVQQEARRAIDCALAVLAAGPHSAAAAQPDAWMLNEWGRPVSAHLGPPPEVRGPRDEVTSAQYVNLYATPPAAPEPLSQRVAELEAALRWIEGETAATPGLTDVELGRALALIGQRAHAALEGPRP